MNRPSAAAAAVILFAILGTLAVAGCQHYHAQDAYQICIDKVNIFLASPAGQLDAALLDGYPPNPGAFKTLLLGECRARYGS